MRYDLFFLSKKKKKKTKTYRLICNTMYEFSLVYINEVYVYVKAGPLSLARRILYMKLSSPAKAITRK